MIYIDVDTAVTVPANVMPLIDDTDFKTRETSVAYNAAGMDLVWNFVTPDGTIAQTAVTPTTGGDYDWSHTGDGMYQIEIPASGGASINNDTEGTGYFTGVCDGVYPWRGPNIVFRAAGLNDLLIESAYSATRGLAGTALPAAAADAAGGLVISDAGGLDIDSVLSGNVPQTGDSYARIGAPAGASIAADVAAVKVEVWSGGSVDFTDQSGNSNNATPQNFPDPIPTTAGPLGEDVVVFDGADGYLNGLGPQTDDMSFGGWYHFPSAPTYVAQLGGADDSGTRLLTWSDGSIRIHTYPEDGSPSANTTNGGAITAGWHHLVVTVTGGNTSSPVVALYIDGALAASKSDINEAIKAASATEINLRDASVSVFDGAAGYHFRTAGVLTAGEVSALYAAATPAAYKALALSYGAVGYWPLAGARHVDLYQSSMDANAAAVRAELATELARIDTAISSRNATAPDNAGIAAIQAKTDNLPGSPAAVGSAMTLADNAITADKYDESTAFPVTSADSGSTQLARTGADGDTLETLSDQIDGVGGSSNPTTLQSTTIATLASQTSFTLTAGSADDDAYNGCMVVLTDQATSTQKAVGRIGDYTGSTMTVTLEAAPPFTIATGDSVDVIAQAGVDVAKVNGTAVSAGALSVSVTSPVAADGELTIYAGAEYSDTDGLAIEFTITNYSGPDLTSDAAILRIVTDAAYKAGTLTPLLELTDGVVTANGSTVTIKFEAAEAETDDLLAGIVYPVADCNHRYQVLTDTGSRLVVRVDGACTVKPVIEAA